MPVPHLPFSRPALRKAAGTLLLLCGVTTLFTGCQVSGSHAQEEQEKARAVATLNGRRAASVQYWEHKTIRGDNAEAYAFSRLALLLPPGVKMTTSHSGERGGMERYDAKFTANGNEFFAGCAVPVTSDGYFLTASHCVESGAATLVVIKDGALCPAPSRVVWSGREDEGGPDLALLYAPVRPGAIFEVAGLSGPETELPVFTAGFGSHAVPFLKAGSSGGRIVSTGSVQARPSGACWRQITHDAPMTPGDSGGPVIDARGRLLAINSAIWVTRSRSQRHYQGVADCPDAGWIQRLIENDRATAQARHP